MAKVYERIARIVDARLRCAKQGNWVWYNKHEDALNNIESFLLPRGSGVNTGTKVDLDRSTGQKLVLYGTWDLMTEYGFHQRSIDFTVTVKPCLMFGFDLWVTGRFGKAQDVKGYLEELYQEALSQEKDVQAAYEAA